MWLRSRRIGCVFCQPTLSLHKRARPTRRVNACVNRNIFYLSGDRVVRRQSRRGFRLRFHMRPIDGDGRGGGGFPLKLLVDNSVFQKCFVAPRKTESFNVSKRETFLFDKTYSDSLDVGETRECTKGLMQPQNHGRIKKNLFPL